MSPSLVTIDTSPDIDLGGNPASAPANGLPSSTTGTTGRRTLLLAPPSVATQGDLAAVIPSYDRAAADLHMLDRLSAGLVTLPAETYDLVLLLTDPDGTRHAEAAVLLSREVFAALVPAMRAGGRLETQDGRFGDKEVREAVLAGLVQKDGAFEKVEEEEVVVPLRFGKKKSTIVYSEYSGTGLPHGYIRPGAEPTSLNMGAPPVKPMPVGVGFDFGDDLDDDDDYIDEDELMTEEDLNRPMQIRTLTWGHHYSFLSAQLLTHLSSSPQPPSAHPLRVRSDAPARTAPAASPSASTLTTRPAAPRPTKT